MPDSSPALFEFGPFRLDKRERLLLRDKEPVPLPPKAFDTLLVLVENSGHVMSKDELMSHVWPDSFVEEANLAQNISIVRKALGDRGDGAQYIETVSKRGYRFSASVRTLTESPLNQPADHTFDDSFPTIGQATDSPVAPAVVPQDLSEGMAADGSAVSDESQAPALRSRPRAWRSALVIAALAAVGIAAALYFSRARERMASSANHGARTLAVLPFQNLRQAADTDFLGFSLADAIITKLDYVGALIVRPSSYVGKYQNKGIDPREVARELNVDTLLTGTYLKDGDDLRITSQLIDPNTNRILWRDTMNLKYEKLLTVQDQVAQQIIKGLEVNLSPDEAERFRRDAPADPIAYEYYLRGIDLAQAGKFPLAIEMLEKSADLDGNYAMSWAQLGAAYTARAAFGFGGRQDYLKAQAAYEKALKLNPDQIEAHVFLANFYTDTNRVEQSVPLLRDAIKTNPNIAIAHWELSYAYRFGGLLEQSIQEAEQARRLDPQVKINSSAMNAYLYSGQYDRFLKSLPDAEASAFIFFYRGYANYYLKNYRQATAAFDRAGELEPSLFPLIGKAFGYSIAGQNQKGKDLLGETEKKVQENGVSDPEALYKIAQAYVAVGDKQSGLRMLGRSIDDGFFCYPYFISDPLLAPIESEPPFDPLMDKARVRHEDFKRKFLNE